MFSYSVGCIFILLISFAVQKLYSLMSKDHKEFIVPTILSLNYLYDKFLDSISSSSFREFSCYFIWGLFLCLPILAASLYF